jgi:hypothetical protein
MPTIDNIVEVLEQERTYTSIDSLFKSIALVFEFDDTYLNAGKTFDVAGYETYTTLTEVAVKFPTTTEVYKSAKAVFDQAANTGVNKSNVERVFVVQKKSTDASYEAGLNRVFTTIAPLDAYWIIPVTRTKAQIESVVDWVTSKRKICNYQSSDADLLTSASTDIATGFKNDNENRACGWYHSTNTQDLAAAVASIMCSARPGDRAAFYKTPTGITVDTITSTQEGYLDGKYCNYFNKLFAYETYLQRSLTYNGLVASGDKVQKILQIDRMVLMLQSASMDALVQDIPYDDRGGSTLAAYLTAVLRQLQNESIISADSKDSDGKVVQGFTCEVLTVADTQTNYLSLYSAQKFKVFIEVYLALTAEKVSMELEY